MSTYAVTLSDLVEFADATCDLDGLKDHASSAAERDRIAARVARLHEIVERAAGDDAGRIYAPEEGAAA